MLRTHKLSRVAQIFVSGVAHFFVVVGGSKIHERLAHFFIDIYMFVQGATRKMAILGFTNQVSPFSAFKSFFKLRLEVHMTQELNYNCCGDYYIPDIRLTEENRPIGRWGRMHRDYIKEHRPIISNDLCLSGNLWTYLADFNEQAQNRLELIIERMKVSEDVTEDMKQHDQMAWVGAMNSIRNRAEEIVLRENDLMRRVRYEIT